MDNSLTALQPAATVASLPFPSLAAASPDAASAGAGRTQSQAHDFNGAMQQARRSQDNPPAKPSQREADSNRAARTERAERAERIADTPAAEHKPKVKAERKPTLRAADEAQAAGSNLPPDGKGLPPDAARPAAAADASVATPAAIGPNTQATVAAAAATLQPAAVPADTAATAAAAAALRTAALPAGPAASVPATLNTPASPRDAVVPSVAAADPDALPSSATDAAPGPSARAAANASASSAPIPPAITLAALAALKADTASVATQAAAVTAAVAPAAAAAAPAPTPASGRAASATPAAVNALRALLPDAPSDVADAAAGLMKPASTPPPSSGTTAQSPAPATPTIALADSMTAVLSTAKVADANQLRAADTAQNDLARVPSAEAPSLATPAVGTGGAQAPAGPPAVFKLNPGLDTPEFSQALAERIAWLFDKDIGAAKLSINPPQLGPIDVHIEVSDDKAQVFLSAHSVVTRDTLEAAAPRLREMLVAQGFSQVNVDVSQRSFQDRDAPAPRQEWMPVAREAASEALFAADALRPRRRNPGALDAYA